MLQGGAVNRLWIGWLLLGACAGADESDGDETEDTTPVCEKRWTVKATDGATAVVADGSLTLTAPTIPTGVVLTMTLDQPLTDDFSAFLPVEGWVAGGSGAFLQAGVSTRSGDFSALAAIGTLPTVGISAVISDANGDDADIQATNAQDLELQFARSNGGVTATADAGTVTASKQGVSVKELFLAIQLGTNGAALASPTSAVITGLTGTGTVGDPDNFDCDSLTLE